MRVRPNYFNSNRHSQSLESYGEISCMEFRTLAHDRSTVSTFGYTTVCEKIDVSPWLRGAASECPPTDSRRNEKRFAVFKCVLRPDGDHHHAVARHFRGERAAYLPQIFACPEITHAR